ncbi:MAG: MopE-related protein [Pseudomonadota bacterium]
MVHRSTDTPRRWILRVTLLVSALVLAKGAALADEGAGPLVITEILSHSADGLDPAEATWFEIYNASDTEVAFSGIVITDHLGGSYMVYRPDAIPPGGFAVFGATKVPQLNGGVPVDVAYGTALTLETLGGSLEIWSEGILLDAVDYGGSLWPALPPGVSATLEPSAADPLSNDDPTRWCASSVTAQDGDTTATSPGAWGAACDSDGDGLSEDDGDCDDGNPDVLPGVAEKCNGFDDDCDGVTDGAEELPDGPSCYPHGVCAETGPTCTGVEGWICEYPESWEDEETLCDSLDNDCDGQTDEGLRNPCGDCGPPEPDGCDGLDNDCDGQTDEDKTPPNPGEICTKDPVGVCMAMQVVCGGVAGWECVVPDDWEPEEGLCDGLDNDCDGDTDEGHGVGEACLTGQGTCEQAGKLACATHALGVECVVEGREIGVELCGDALDNDCDVDPDEDFRIGEPCHVGKGTCAVTGKWICSLDRLTEICSAQPGLPKVELCSNHLDDNCDGDTDEAPCDPDSQDQGAAQGCGPGPPADAGSMALLLLLIASLVRRRTPQFP